LNQTKNITYYLILSGVAVALVLLVALVNASTVNPITIMDKLFVAGAFTLVCIFGISLAIYPKWYKKHTKRGHTTETNLQTQKTDRKYKGHHPDCMQFTGHTITTKNITVCAGCIGLSLGSLISILFIVLYIFVLPRQPILTYHIFIIGGMIMIGLVFLEIMFPLRNPGVHVIANSVLVISFLLVTLGILEITGNKIYAMLTILLSFLWLDTRIQLSSWQHSKICDSCTKACKMY
jgi:hypothetical protein